MGSLAKQAGQVKRLRAGDTTRRAPLARRLRTLQAALAAGRPFALACEDVLAEMAAALRIAGPLCLFAPDATDSAFRRLAAWGATSVQPCLVLPPSCLAPEVRAALARGEAQTCAAADLVGDEMDRACRDLLSQPGRQCLLLPILAGERWLGFVLALHEGVRPSRAQMEEIDLWAVELAVLLRQEEALAAATADPGVAAAELAAENHRLGALNRVAATLAGELDMESVWETVVAEAIGTLGMEAAALLLPSESREEYVVRAQRGLDARAANVRVAAVDIQDIAGLATEPIYRRGQSVALPGWVRALLSCTQATCLAALPLRHSGRLAGLLALFDGHGPLWGEAGERDLALAFASQVAGTLVSAEHHRETEYGAAESTFLLQISQLLSSTFDMDAILRTLAEEASDLMESDVCALYLYEPLNDTVELAAVQGARRTTIVDAGLARLPLKDLPSVQRAARSGRPNASAMPEPGDLLRRFGPALAAQASLTVPLRAHDTLLGFIFLTRRTPRRFTQLETQLGLKLGALAALALDNARLYADVQEQMRQLQLAQTQLIEVEKMASLGRIVAGVAHELNNPLAIVSGYAQVLLGSDLPPELRPDLERIDHGARRAAQVVRDLLAFARQQPITPLPMQMGDLLREVVAQEQPGLEEAGISLDLDIAPDLPRVRGDRQQLEQVLHQLIANARRAIAGRPGASRITIRARYTDRLLIAISDDGPGIPPDLIDKVFEPFLTTQEVGQGSGLGLSMCYGVIRSHGGHIRAANNPTGGATFTIELPGDGGRDA